MGGGGGNVQEGDGERGLCVFEGDAADPSPLSCRVRHSDVPHVFDLLHCPVSSLRCVKEAGPGGALLTQSAAPKRELLHRESEQMASSSHLAGLYYKLHKIVMH